EVFVHERVDKHSPSFSWKGADLQRVLRLVVDCSRSPHLEAQTADELAAELVLEQEKERELVRELATKLSDSFGSIRTLATSAVLPQASLKRWAEEQQRGLQAIVRGAALPSVETLRVSAPIMTLRTGDLLSASVRLPEPTLSVLTTATRSA